MSNNIPSWKKFGGINNMEKTNNISTNSLSANFFTLKNSYVGYFSICGELSVTEDTYLGSNVVVGGNVQIEYDANIDGNVFIQNNEIVYGNVDIGGNVDISGNTLIRGNLHILQNYEIEKNLKINGNLIQMGLLTRSANLYGTNTYNVNITTVDQKIGINNSNPIYALDMCCNQIKGFSIASNLPSNQNIVAQNNAGQGIIVSGNTTSSAINFFNESNIQSNTDSDGSIIYNSGGNFIIKSSNNTFLNTSVSVSNRNLGLHTAKKETLVIYDISSGAYLFDNYEDSNYNTGSAVSLISDNSFSTTALNILTPDGLGLAITAGSDTSNQRSLGTFGVYDTSDNHITTQTIIAGNSTIVNRSTVGINTFKPITEKYVLDINGPTKINHNEIVLVSNCNFEIRNMCFSKTNPLKGFAFGSPIYDTINNTYKQIIRYTTDGGITWDDSFFIGIDPGVSIVLQSSCIYDAEQTPRCIGFIGGGNGLFLFSTDFFQSWTQIDGTSLNVTITAIEVVKEPSSSNLILFTTYTLNSQISIGYFIVSGENIFTDNTNANFIVSTTNSFSDRSLFFSNTIPI
jgi:predicted acyltransferase (DUF342 family)